MGVMNFIRRIFGFRRKRLEPHDLISPDALDAPQKLHDAMNQIIESLNKLKSHDSQ